MSLKDSYVANTYYSSYDLVMVRNMDDYWNVNQQILDGRFKGIIIPERQISEDVRVGWHTIINPTVTIKPPILIGSNCNIMKGAVVNGPVAIGNNVVVDKGAIIEKSIILNNTYVGPNTEVKNSVVRKNNIVNIPRMVSTFVSEDFILGDIEKNILSDKGMLLVNITIALLLLAISSPVFIVKYLNHLVAPSMRILYSENRYGRNEIAGLDGEAVPKVFDLYLFKSSIPVIRKIPGLINVLKGEMSMVGNTPLTEIEAELLKEEWERLRFSAPSGLFSIWEAEAEGDPAWEEKIIMENYYTVTRTFLMDIRILLKSILKLLLPCPGGTASGV